MTTKITIEADGDASLGLLQVVRDMDVGGTNDAKPDLWLVAPGGRIELDISREHSLRLQYLDGHVVMPALQPEPAADAEPAKDALDHPTAKKFVPADPEERATPRKGQRPQTSN